MRGGRGCLPIGRAVSIAFVYSCLVLVGGLSDAGPMDKPTIIKTHVRDLVITPELIGSIVAIYNGKVGTSRGS